MMTTSQLRHMLIDSRTLLRGFLYTEMLTIERQTVIAHIDVIDAALDDPDWGTH